MADLNRDRFQILSLDGGGIKGLFSAALLAKLEEDLQVNVASHFDLITGTSTGGIIALALGKGLSPQQIVDFYVRLGPKIFGRRRLLRRVRWLFSRKYPQDELGAALRECFGDTTVGESRKRLVIPSYNVGNDQVYVIKTPHHTRLMRDGRQPMWTAALATSAAPTYFPSCQVIDGMRLIDGGVWANNPTMVGLVEALTLLEIPIGSVRVLRGCLKT